MLPFIEPSMGANGSAETPGACVQFARGFVLYFRFVVSAMFCTGLDTGWKLLKQEGFVIAMRSCGIITPRSPKTNFKSVALLVRVTRPQCKPHRCSTGICLAGYTTSCSIGRTDKGQPYPNP